MIRRVAETCSKNLSVSIFFAIILFCSMIGPASGHAVAKELTCSKMPSLMDSFLSSHYAITNIDNPLRARAVDQMIKYLDPTKTLFYASDVEWLKKILHNYFVGLQRGNCDLRNPVYDLLLKRSRENTTILRDVLKAYVRPDKTVELQMDTKKRAYAQTVADKINILKNVAQFQIENDILAGIKPEEAVSKQIHRAELQTEKILKETPERLIGKAAESFALALDPHTNYLPPDLLAEIFILTKLSLEGIGVQLSSRNGFTYIDEIIPGGSAERSGMLKPMDKIIAVAQDGGADVDIVDMDLRDILKLIRGDKGTKVTLTIVRTENGVSRMKVTVVRDKVDLKGKEARMTIETRKVDKKIYRFGVIELPTFYSDDKKGKYCHEDVEKLLRDAMVKDVDGIVLDLSQNRGGVLEEAVMLTGLFVGHGGVVGIKDHKDRVKIYVNGSRSVKDRRKTIKVSKKHAQPVYSGPVVVLTSRMSASASEIVAGALKDYQRAVVVGQDRTFGKGSVQMLSQLPGGIGGMKVTTTLYFLPCGKSTQNDGVISDIQLPVLSLYENIGESLLDYSLPTQSIAPFLEGNGSKSWRMVNQGMLDDLNVRSKARVAKDTKFIEIINDHRLSLRKNGTVRVADLRKNAPTKVGEKSLNDLYVPYLNESVNVLLDMISYYQKGP